MKFTKNFTAVFTVTIIMAALAAGCGGDTSCDEAVCYDTFYLELEDDPLENVIYTLSVEGKGYNFNMEFHCEYYYDADKEEIIYDECVHNVGTLEFTAEIKKRISEGVDVTLRDNNPGDEDLLDSITVTVRFCDEEIGRQTYTPEYDTWRVNGAGCPPLCLEASDVMDLKYPESSDDVPDECRPGGGSGADADADADGDVDADADADADASVDAAPSSDAGYDSGPDADADAAHP